MSHKIHDNKSNSPQEIGGGGSKIFFVTVATFLSAHWASFNEKSLILVCFGKKSSSNVIGLA